MEQAYTAGLRAGYAAGDVCTHGNLGVTDSSTPFLSLINQTKTLGGRIEGSFRRIVVRKKGCTPGAHVVTRAEQQWQQC